MMSVTTDGYIAGVFGPYPGNKNDATILNELLNKNIWQSFESGDVFLIDRGFRDSNELIFGKGFIPKMPEFADSPRSTLTTAQANRSRLVTKNRFIVEVINGRAKQFKHFDQTIQNSTLESVFEDFRIVCGILNMCFEPLKSSTNDNLIAERMLQLVDRNNPLSDLVEEQNLNARKSNFQRIEVAEITYFPKFDISQLQLYTCGTYQIRMAKSYYADHIAQSGDFEFQVAKETAEIDFMAYSIALTSLDSLFIKTRLRSRHSNATKYFVYVLIGKSKEGIDAIIGHTCGCKIGKRVVGCCSHVATVLWYFSYARHLNEIPAPARHLVDYFEESSGEDTE